MKFLSSRLGQLGQSGQSYIIQFILFFLIGIGLFIGIGNFFLIQYELIRRDTVGVSIEMINGYISSLIVASVDGCLRCGTVEHNIRVSDTTAGYFLEFILDKRGLVVSTVPPEESYISSINNLNYTFKSLGGSAPSIRTINLTYDRNQNMLYIT